VNEPAVNPIVNVSLATLVVNTGAVKLSVP
jgi:hypothetical protein